MDIFGDLSRAAKKPACFGATGERQVYPLGKIPSKFGATLDPIRGDPHGEHQGTMVENRKKHRQNSHLIIYFPMSEGVSGVSE